MQPNYMEVVQNTFNEENLNHGKTVIRWATLNNAAGMLLKLKKASWDFYSKTLRGAQKQNPLTNAPLRSKRNGWRSCREAFM